MGKKGASYQPADNYVPPHSRHNQAAENSPGVAQGTQPQQPCVPRQPQYNASPAIPPNPYFTLPQNAVPRPQPPPQPRANYQRGALNPQADSYRPGNRYTPPQTRNQRRQLHFSSTDQAIPSIETPMPPSTQPPWRLPLRNVKPKPYVPRNRYSTTPGLPDRPVTPPPAPKPSEPYLQRALQASERLTRPKKLLVLLDLNGTLLYRPRLAEHGSGPRRREHILRPGAQKLIDYLFENHAVMVYTSAMKRNAEVCVEALLRHLTPEQRSKVIGIRPRERLGLTTTQLNARVQVYKPLEPVWVLEKVVANGKQNSCKWDDTNTVLLDDSLEKAVGNPHSLLQVPEFTLPDGTKEHNMPAKTIESEQAIMTKVQQKLEELKWEVSITRKIREWQKNQETLVDVPESVGDAVKSTSPPDPKSGSDAGDTADVAAAAYPTPESTGADEDGVKDESEGGVRLRSPTPMVEQDFDFVEGSKKKEETSAII